MAKKKSKYLSGRRIDPRPITGGESVADLVDETFLAYNAARLREACQLFALKMLEPDVTVGLSVTGALTPAGLGISALIPLMRAGFVDWVITTGANLYHDTHFGIGLSLHQGSTAVSDIVLRSEEVVRIYDIFFDYSVLLDTDEFFRRLIEGEEFQRAMSTAEFHNLCGKYVLERERKLGLENKSFLAAAYELGVPIYTSSPGVCREYPARSRCAYYDVLQFERRQQADDTVIPVVQITYREVKKKKAGDNGAAEKVWEWEPEKKR